MGSLDHPANKHIVTAWKKGRPLHVVERGPSRRGDYTPYRYVDAFMLDDVTEDGGWPIFHLRPVESATHRPQQACSIGLTGGVRLVTVERHQLLTLDSSNVIESVSLRPEARLEKKFSLFMLQQGLPVWRFEIRHTPGCHPMYTDIWIGGANILIEAKSSSDREHVRSAIAQLLDYTRFLRNPGLAILLPDRPLADVLNFAYSQNVAVIWPHGTSGWQSSLPHLTPLGVTCIP
ncbi:hypothetical protein ACPC54_40790 [Kitasatospora sp. NPDC094028]